MPRPNPPRTIASEANLARRIAYERESHGWSYEALAKAMTEAGCAMQGSAIFRIEKGDPPRRVTVDELVAFSSVFDKPVDDLLTPMELIEQQRAKELVADLNGAFGQLVDLIGLLVRVYGDFFEVARDNPDLFQYIDGHWSTLDYHLLKLPTRLLEEIGAMTDGEHVPPLERGLRELIAGIQFEIAARRNPSPVPGLTYFETREATNVEH